MVFYYPDDHKLKKGDESIFMVTPEERGILKERFSN